MPELLHSEVQILKITKTNLPHCLDDFSQLIRMGKLTLAGIALLGEAEAGRRAGTGLFDKSISNTSTRKLGAFDELLQGLN